MIETNQDHQIQLVSDKNGGMNMKPRDRIIELIQEVQYLGGIELRLADHLLANGVTVGGEWISVANRLPAETGKYLVCRKFQDGRQGVGVDVFYSGQGKTAWKNDFIIGIGGTVTHWMELPEPPKEG